MISIDKKSFHSSRAALYNFICKEHSFTIEEYEQMEKVIQYLLEKKPNRVIQVNDNKSGIWFFTNEREWLHYNYHKFWAIRTLRNRNNLIDTTVIKYEEIFKRY